MELSGYQISRTRLKEVFMNFRLGIGILFALPFMLFGMFTEFALMRWNLNLISSNFIRIFLSFLLAIISLPFVWLINDYYDAPFDLLDINKSNRNFFCSDRFKENRIVGYIIIILPLICSISISLILGLELFIISIIFFTIGHFYSSPPFRFKEKPFFDIITHGFYVGGFFFLLGGYIFSPINVLMTQPIFILFFILSFIDAAWIQFNAQLLDFEIDKLGKQRTTSLYIGKKWSLWILRMLISLILITLPLYLYLNSSLINIVPLIGIWIGIILSMIVCIIYLWNTRDGKDKFDSVRKYSARVRRRFIYTFAILSIIFINTPLL